MVSIVKVLNVSFPAAEWRGQNRKLKQVCARGVAGGPAWICPPPADPPSLLGRGAGRGYSTGDSWGKKKHASKRKVRLHAATLAMDPEVEQQLAPLRARCKEQVGHPGRQFRVCHDHGVLDALYHGPRLFLCNITTSPNQIYWS